MWKEIRTDYIEELEDGSNVQYIDAWVTGDDNEEGKTIATIKDGVVTYRDSRASTDIMAQNIIQEIVREQISNMNKSNILFVEGEDELPVKRFYIPLVIERDCPHCGNKCKRDLGQEYLMYPMINTKEQMYFYCDECEGEFNVEYTLRIGLELGKTNKL